MASERKKRITYQSAGTDDVWVPCDTADEAASIFKMDAESLMGGEFDNELNITLKIREMTDEEIAALPEM